MSTSLTRAQLRERAQQVAQRFHGQVVMVDDDELAALARAWGVEVAPVFPSRLLTSPCLAPNIYDVHDEAGKPLLCVDTLGNLDLLHDLIRARHQQLNASPWKPRPAWRVKFDLIRHIRGERTRIIHVVVAETAIEAADLVRARHADLGVVEIDEVEVIGRG